MMKIFLSAVSGQFKACRDALASDLRAIGCEVRVQEDFQQGPRTLIERLEEYLAQCDRVIALVGDAYGFEASGEAVPAVDPPRSYTQWEYFFARGERLDGAKTGPKDFYVYFASDRFLGEHPVQQSPDHAERQRGFLDEVKASGKHWAAFDSLDQLCRLVLRDGWQMNGRPAKPRNLPYDSIGALFKGRDPSSSKTSTSGLSECRGMRRRSSPNRRFTASAAWAKPGSPSNTLRHRDEYSALLFVLAESPEALRRNLAVLCAPAVLNLPEQEAKEEDVRVAATVHWLNRHPG
jgi:hypothetical protein